MSTPGFTATDDGLERRARAVAAVADALTEAADAAVVASDPRSFGLLCAFFPTLLDPAQQQARDALGRAAETCRRSAGDLDAAGTAFGATDDAGAGGFGR